MADESSNPDNTKLVHEGWSTLSEKKRGCTDCLCVLLLVACWVAMTLVGFIACGVIHDPRIPAGNPNRLINAVDYQSHICGSGVRKNQKYGYYLPDGTAVCVSSCPSKDNYNEFVCQYDLQASVDADNTYLLGNQYFLEYKCMYNLKTSVVFNRCLPDAAVQLANATAANSNYNPSGNNAWFTTFLGDLYNLQGVIFGVGLGLSTGVAFAYLYFLRIPGLLFLIVWGLILFVLFMFLIGSFLLWSLANSWNGDGVHTSGEVTMMWIIAYVGMAISFLYFCLVLVLRSRVQLAIVIVKQAARALAAMPLLLLSPVIQAVGIAAFMVPWIIYVLYLASSGEMVVKHGTYYDSVGMSHDYTYRTFEYNKNTKYAFLYLIFSLFWTSEFIVAFGQLVIALAMSNYYFTRDKSTVGNNGVFWALRTATFYHMGTAAFGSLIIAIIKTIRFVIAYIQRKAKKSGNKILVYLLCVCQCCMWCLEKIMKFINKKAYIQTAIYGYSFCKAARSAFFLILRNILRVAAVSMVGDFVLLLGKLFVVGITVFVAYLIMAYGQPATITGVISPLVFVGVMAYFVASMFSEIFGMGIETMLCCFIADEEMFPAGQRFADGDADGIKQALQKAEEKAHNADNGPKVAPAPDEKWKEAAPVVASPAEVPL